MCCLEGRLFFSAQGCSLISPMVNPALIVPLCKMADITVKLSITPYTIPPSQRNGQVVDVEVCLLTVQGLAPDDHLVAVHLHNFHLVARVVTGVSTSHVVHGQEHGGCSLEPTFELYKHTVELTMNIATVKRPSLYLSRVRGVFKLRHVAFQKVNVNVLFEISFLQTLDFHLLKRKQDGFLSVFYWFGYNAHKV